MDGEEAKREFLSIAERNIRRYLPAPLAFELEAQDQHCEGVEGKAPDHTKCVCLAQGDNVAATGNDRDQLEDHDHVDDAVAGAKTLVRPSEPIGEDAVLAYPIQHPICADDRGV